MEAIFESSDSLSSISTMFYVPSTFTSNAIALTARYRCLTAHIVHQTTVQSRTIGLAEATCCITITIVTFAEAVSLAEDTEIWESFRTIS